MTGALQGEADETDAHQGGADETRRPQGRSGRDRRPPGRSRDPCRDWNLEETRHKRQIEHIWFQEPRQGV